MDGKLTFDAGIRPDAMYSEEKWMRLNPEGFNMRVVHLSYQKNF